MQRDSFEKHVSHDVKMAKKLSVMGIDVAKIPFRKVIVPFLGVVSLIWFLCRVIPKPSRASYPCMKIAFPIATGFIGYISAFFATVITFRIARNRLQSKNYITGGIFVVIAVLACFIWLGFTDNPALASNIQLVRESVNTPIGTAKGIYPGRVVWTYDPDATNQYCSNTSGDYWWDNANTNKQVVNDMLVQTMQSLTGAADINSAWDAVFRHYNVQNGLGDKGYVPGDKIAIKLNLCSADAGINSDYSKRGYISMIDTSPQLTYAVLDQLINGYGVPQEDIYIGDPHRYFYKRLYDELYPSFPGVHYLDPDGNMGRMKVVTTASRVLQYSDKTKSDYLPQQFVDASYMINIPCLKAHNIAGVSMCAKNHYGSHCQSSAAHLHYALPGSSPGMGRYRNLVDMMGHEDLGGKTVLYLIDALYGYYDWGSGAPRHWNSAPFNGDFTSSLIASLDPVAVESVGLDFLKAEYSNYPYKNGTDDYLHQAADPANWPAGITYDPEGDGSVLDTLGVHEHWNNAADKKYTRNLGTGDGIELYVPGAEPTPTMTPIMTNIALHKNVVASGQYSADFPKTAINDGNTGTIWGSLYNAGPQWIFVDLLEVRDIDHVVVRFFDPYNSPYYHVGISNDAATWEFAATITNGDGGDDTIAVNRSARYVGLYLTQGAKKVYGIKEFEVNALVMP